MPRGFVNRRDRFRWDNVHFPDGENPLSSDFVKVGDDTLTDVLDRIDDGVCYVTATPGASVSFTTSVAEPLKALKVAITATQSGTGDPTPDNVREINGYTACTITVTDGVTPETYMVQFGVGAGTVYGGTLDAVTGVLTVTFGRIDLTAITDWTYNADSSKWLSDTIIPNMIAPDGTESFSKYAMCNKFKCVRNTGSPENAIMSTTAGRLRIGTSTITTAEELATAIAGAYLVFTLITPDAYQLTPAGVETLIGSNTVSASTGDITELIYPDTYTNQVDLLWQAIEALQGSREIKTPESKKEE